MKPMLDKDFDKIFHDKFDSWEVEPSDRVWPGIAQHINKSKKRPFPVLWIAAASLVAVITAGMWFSSQQEPMKLTGTNVVPEIKPKPVAVSQAPEAIVVETKTVVQKVVLKPEKEAGYVAVKINFKSQKTKNANLIKSDKSDITEAKSTQVVLDQADKSLDVVSLVNTHTMANSLVEDDLSPKDESVKSAKLSKSVVSSVVNYVIGKVDKRKDKIIELEDNDEGTKVKSMNLILLKFKAKE